MLAHRYVIWKWGLKRGGGDPYIQKNDIALTAIAKRHPANNYEVFNELVSMHLGRMLGLPIPIGFVIENDKQIHYCSADTALVGGQAPKAEYDEFAEANPHMAIGVVLFDAWICNQDRTRENAIYDCFEDKIYLIDHGRALLADSGLKSLLAQKGKIALCPDLAQHISNAEPFECWYNRLLRLPEYLITTATREAATVGISEEEADAVARFLLDRRLELWGLLENNQKSLFPKLQQRQRQLFSPFRYEDDPSDFSI